MFIEFYKERLRHLEDNLTENGKLLKQYEDALRYESDPQRREGYQKRIKEIKDVIQEDQQEYESISSRIHKTISKGNIASDTTGKFEGNQLINNSYYAEPLSSSEVKGSSEKLQNATENLGNGVTLEMIFVPGDKLFLMGSPGDEMGQSYTEGPQHYVKITPFYVGKYSVTQAQWWVVAALPRVNIDLNPEPSLFKGANLPVESVSWYEAAEFCQRLSKKMGEEYRLLSEAEWEYACRAGTTTPFHFGETITADLANYDGNYIYAGSSKGKYNKKTTLVGSFPANNFGLHDMHGNVWEWCADHWHENYEGAPNDGSVWLSSDESSRRIIRGGSWSLSSWNCRSACRNWLDPDSMSPYLGFRVSRCVSRIK